MKYLTILVFISIQTVQASVWMHSFEDAQKRAFKEGTLMLVDFAASWCGPCKRMDRETWKKDEVMSLMLHYVPVKVDVMKRPDISHRYKANAIPHIMIMDPAGNILWEKVGYMKTKAVKQVLAKYRLDLSGLTEDLANYKKERTAMSTYSMAERYMDMLPKVPSNVRKNIAKLSMSYLDEATSYLNAPSDQNLLAEEIRLLQIEALFIAGKRSKASKFLEGLDPLKLHDINKDQFAYVNYCLWMVKKKDEHAQPWKEKLLETQAGKEYLERVEALFVKN